MKYKNANLVLPDSLVKELQKYFQGGYIYVPINEDVRKSWGELSGYKDELEERNSNIIQKFRKGIPIEALADEFYLSVHAIRKIIYKKV
ncbi:CD3324 family protein [Anaerocolumna chitinilytica]|uniref:Mor transcription activator domain-containing protein n=1 Tax=Anaerocolumna chitinilytica TaxID=1727145 RepID=A0A7I8DNG9_9FIRM|nr:CD3324 family protein [Anaerocolumna chitinilytica]BCJ99953.1 hypothetical protein bsdcttw_29940 [Anaerocolumna chitinilytica]